VHRLENFFGEVLSLDEGDQAELGLALGAENFVGLFRAQALLAGRLGAGGLYQLQSQCKLVQRLGASFAPTA